MISGAKCYSLLVRAVERLFLQSSKDSFLIFPDKSSANCHVYHQLNLCHDLSTIMDVLFQDLVTISADLPHEWQQTKAFNKLQLPKIPCHDIIQYYIDIENRFTNVCIYLATLLK